MKDDPLYQYDADGQYYMYDTIDMRRNFWNGFWMGGATASLLFFLITAFVYL